MPNNHQQKDLSRGALIYFLGMPGKFAGFLVMWIAARYYGSEELGIYVGAWSIFQLIHMVVVGGLSESLNLQLSKSISYEDRFTKFRGDQVDKIMGGHLLLGLVLSMMSSLAILLGVEPINNLLGLNLRPSLVHSLQILSLTLPFHFIIQFSVSSLRAILQVKYDMIINSIIKQTLFMVIVLLGIQLQSWESRLVWFQIAVYFISTFIALYGLSQWFNFRGILKNLQWNPKSLKAVVPLSVNDVLNHLIQEMDIIMITLIGLSSDLDISFYGVALSVVFGLRMMRKNFTKVFIPIASRLMAEENWSELNIIFNNTQRWILYLSLPLFSLFLLFPDIILQFYGAEYRTYEQIFLVLSLVGLGDAFFGIFNSLFVAAGKSVMAMKNSMFIIAVNLVLNALLIPLWGISGAAIGTLVGLVLSSTIVMFRTFKHFHEIQMLWSSISKPILSLGLPLIILLLSKGSIIQNNLVLFILWIAMVLITQVLVGFNEFDRNILMKKSGSNAWKFIITIGMLKK